MLYGTTTSGGESGNGVVFAVNARTGVEAVLHSFAGGTDGAVPFAGLTQLGGALYGVTYFGGASNNGTVYRIDPATGSETVIYAFKGKSFEGNPAATMVANNGLLYGTTAHGGLRKCHGSGCGTVFAIDPATGNETKLYSFDGFRDGQDPEGAMAVLGGSLYGATLEGGRSELGTVFKIDLATGTETVLHDFEKATDGSNPGTLIYHAGHLFGTTAGESAAGFGTVFTLKP